MKRIIYPALLIFCMLLMPAEGPSLARPEAQAAKPITDWKQLRDGVQTATVWDTIGPKWPQAVLFQLRQDEYEKLLSGPEKYINDLKVLGESSTHKVHFCHLPKKNKKPSKDQLYILMIIHEQDTVCYVMVSVVGP
jgi:hypothetical protein